MSLAMRMTVSVTAYMICMDHGLRIPAPNDLVRGSPRAEGDELVKLNKMLPSIRRVGTRGARDPLAVIATLLMALKSKSAWSAGAQATCCPLGSRALSRWHSLALHFGPRDVQSEVCAEVENVQKMFGNTQRFALAGSLSILGCQAAFKLPGLAASVHGSVHRTGHPNMVKRADRRVGKRASGKSSKKASGQSSKQAIGFAGKQAAGFAVKRASGRAGKGASVQADKQTTSVILPTVTQLEDSRIWLEDIDGRRASDWVNKQNAHALRAFGKPETQPAYKRFLDMLDSTDKLPVIDRVLDGLYYNFFQDEEFMGGVWRRCTLDEYRKKKPAWETVLDMSAMQADKVFSRVTSWGCEAVLKEPNKPTDRVMLGLSRDGSDAQAALEFDLHKKGFVPEQEGGFVLPEAKTFFCYKDRNTLIVGGVFGDQDMTNSGYPRCLYEWERGTALQSAKKVYEGKQTDIEVRFFYFQHREQQYEVAFRMISNIGFGRYELKQPNGSFVHIPIPEDASLSIFADQILVSLSTPWLGHSAGALLSAPLQEFTRAGNDEARKAMITVLFTPTSTCHAQSLTDTTNYVILHVFDNVVSELRFWKFDKGTWSLEHSYKDEDLLAFDVFGLQTDDLFCITKGGYVQPSTVFLANASNPQEQEKLQSEPSFFDAKDMITEQHFAISVDGTKVPYFLVSKKDLPLDGSTPTLLTGYGGFGTLPPRLLKYDSAIGAGWLEKGYAYAVANIRGGGEYGPDWYKAGVLENRHRSYEDFESVARDLIARGITSSKKLACEGFSNGGFLTGNMLVRSPDLFGAIVCSVPLLDMYRYPKLLAGPSWIGEYGDPEKDWNWLQQYSPYHNIKLETEYPPILFTSRKNDDRVHPAHARKMVRKLLDMGKNNTYYYENFVGGHADLTNDHRAFMQTLQYSFLEQVLGRA